MPNSEGELDKGDLYLGKFKLKYIGINNTWVNQIFIICYDFIKYNSYVNLDDGNHIGIVWSGSNAVKTHNVSYVLFF